MRFHLGTIRGIGDPDSYILPEQPQSSIPPAKINISLSIPFDKLPEDGVVAVPQVRCSSPRSKSWLAPAQR